MVASGSTSDDALVNGMAVRRDHAKTRSLSQLSGPSWQNSFVDHKNLAVKTIDRFLRKT